MMFGIGALPAALFILLLLTFRKARDGYLRRIAPPRLTSVLRTYTDAEVLAC